MRINPRIYDYADEENLIESQKLESGHTVELYRLNPYDDLLYEFTGKGKFAVWSSQNGNDYRLYVEDGYYNELKPLYQDKINDIWLEFWDNAERVSNKFRNIIMPLALLAILLGFGSSFFLGNNMISIGVTCAVAATYFIFVMAYKKVLNRQINAFNSEAVGKIKQVLGEKRFANLLDKQRSYIDEYFKNLPEDDYSDDSEEAALEEASVSTDNEAEDAEEPSVIDENTESVDDSENKNE